MPNTSAIAAFVRRAIELTAAGNAKAMLGVDIVRVEAGREHVLCSLSDGSFFNLQISEAANEP